MNICALEFPPARRTELNFYDIRMIYWNNHPHLMHPLITHLHYCFRYGALILILSKTIMNMCGRLESRSKVAVVAPAVAQNFMWRVYVIIIFLLLLKIADFSIINILLVTIHFYYKNLAVFAIRVYCPIFYRFVCRCLYDSNTCLTSENPEPVRISTLTITPLLN